MHIKKISIRNFRAIDAADIYLDKKITVIVGANGIGKTTILEAVRLTRALLTPRTQNEPTNALTQLGAMVPYLPNQMQIYALWRRPHEPIVLSQTLELTHQELADAKSRKNQIVEAVVRNGLGQQFAGPAQLAGFLSSIQGKATLKQADADVSAYLTKLELNPNIELTVTISEGQPAIASQDPIGPVIVSALEQMRPPHRTLFSYFPADRVLPQGEQPIQFGAPDAGSQLESNNSSPGLKYVRLKNTIFNAILAGQSEKDRLEAGFREIFENLLKGIEFAGSAVTPVGTLAINVKDGAGRIFSVDNLSSGEKNLILTFLTILMSLDWGGIALLDEPEQHLNPLICKGLIQYIKANFTEVRDLQFIICSHSPEILAGTFGATDCALWRIVSSNECLQLRAQDHGAAEEALRNLGSSESEALIYDGLIFVEGIDDAEILEAGFSNLLRKYKVIDMCGRPEIEKSIAKLQDEKRGKDKSMRYFIFDRDKKPAALKDTERVKIRQLRMYCLENYLIDIDVIFDLLKSGDYGVPQSNYNLVDQRIKNLAFSQIDEIAFQRALETLELPRFERILSPFDSGKLDLYVDGVANQIAKFVAQLAISASELGSTIRDAYERNRREILKAWEKDWRTLCNGKIVFDDIYINFKMTTSKTRFKRAIIKEMCIQKRDGALELERLIQEMLGS